MHEFEIKQAERIYELIHHIFLRLAERSITADEITLLKFFEYLAEPSVVCQSRGVQQVLSGHSFAFAFQGFNYGKMVVGFLEERTEQTVKLFGEFAATGKAKLLDILCHTFVVFEKRQVISYTAHCHIALNDFRALIIKTLCFEILFYFMQLEGREQNVVSNAIMEPSP